MDGISVVEFQKEFTEINLRLMKEDIKLYDLVIIGLYTVETKRGFKVKKIGKTGRAGTKVTFEVIKDKKDFEEYLDKLKGMLDEYNKKYDTSYTLEK
ncbi:hypothetical protein [Clostridium perfringens]|uniref:hypothetical protein n=1 Tax=Clostridium perfringens TaxID=1502 RepID=UPI0024BCA13E|nr:hypothetical protein [Clostridium perfringens]